MSTPRPDNQGALTVHAPPVPQRQRRIAAAPRGGIDLAHPVASLALTDRPESAAEQHVERLEENAGILAAIRRELPREALYHVTLRMIGSGELVVAGSVPTIATKQQVLATCRTTPGVHHVLSELEVA